MKFGCLDDLIEFEQGLEWVKDNGRPVRLGPGLKAKYDRLRGDKYFGIYDNHIVSVVSGDFKTISVNEIVQACDEQFGNDFAEKSYREGIVRIYDKGVEDNTGKVSPLVVFPANLGTMAVKLGVYHNAYVCSNGLIMSDNHLSERIVHRLSASDLTQRVKRVSDNLGLVLKGVSKAQEITIEPGVQVAMIVQALNKTDNLVKKAVNKYMPEDETLWSTIQSITYVATHETKKGYPYSRNAGNYLLEPELSEVELLDAANYVFAKQSRGLINFPHSSELFSLAREVLA